MKKVKTKATLTIVASCGSQGCNIPAHEKILPRLIANPIKKAA